MHGSCAPRGREGWRRAITPPAQMTRGDKSRTPRRKGRLCIRWLITTVKAPISQTYCAMNVIPVVHLQLHQYIIDLHPLRAFQVQRQFQLCQDTYFSRVFFFIDVCLFRGQEDTEHVFFVSAAFGSWTAGITPLFPHLAYLFHLSAKESVGPSLMRAGRFVHGGRMMLSPCCNLCKSSSDESSTRDNKRLGCSLAHQSTDL